MTENNDGFSPENIQRIYLGQPALVEGELPEEILSARQYETAQLFAAGLDYEQVSERLGLGLSTLREHTHGAYTKLGITTRTQLPGFFPLDPSEPLNGERLQDLTVKQLSVIELLSRGQTSSAAALTMGVSAHTVRYHLSSAKENWSACGGSAGLVGVANKIRSSYAREYESQGGSATECLGSLALDKLIEPGPNH